MERTGIHGKSRHSNNTIRFVLSERANAAPDPDTLAAKYLGLMVHKSRKEALWPCRAQCHTLVLLAMMLTCSPLTVVVSISRQPNRS